MNLILKIAGAIVSYAICFIIGIHIGDTMSKRKAKELDGLKVRERMYCRALNHLAHERNYYEKKYLRLKNGDF